MIMTLVFTVNSSLSWWNRSEKLQYQNYGLDEKQSFDYLYKEFAKE